MRFYSDFMGFYSDFMRFYSDFMRCYSDFMRFYSDFIVIFRDFHEILMGYEWEKWTLNGIIYPVGIEKNGSIVFPAIEFPLDIEFPMAAFD